MSDYFGRFYKGPKDVINVTRRNPLNLYIGSTPLSQHKTLKGAIKAARRNGEGTYRVRIDGGNYIEFEVLPYVANIQGSTTVGIVLGARPRVQAKGSESIGFSESGRLTDAAFTGTALYSTSFDYTQECSLDGEGGFPTCSGATLNGDIMDWVSASNGGVTPTRAVAAASRTVGTYGLRQYMQDGNNVQSGSAILSFSNISGAAADQTEFWVRWYERWESGFQWTTTNPLYKKMMYWRTGSYSSFSGGPTQAVFDWAGDSFIVVKQGTSSPNQLATSGTTYSWANVHGNPASGSWVKMEVYMKMDTDQTDGVCRVWIGDTLVVENTGVDFSNGNASAQTGWTWAEIPNNQSFPDNGTPSYVDIDDIEIWNTIPPNTDSSGNPRIG